MALGLNDPLIPDDPSGFGYDSVPSGSPSSVTPTSSALSSPSPSAAPPPSMTPPSITTPTSTGAPAPSSPGAPGLPATTVAPTNNQALISGVDPSELVSTQLDKLLNADSPVLQNARSNAQQQAASRGLQNSTLAAGSGEKALIETATPIAAQDATTNYQRNAANLTAQNQFGLQAAGVEGQLKLGEQDLASKTSLLNSETAARSQLLTQDGAQRLQEIAVQQQGAVSLQQMQQAHDEVMLDLSTGQQLTVENAKFQNQMALSVAQYGQQVGLSQLDQQNKLQQMNDQNLYTLQQIDEQARATGVQNTAALGSQYLASVSNRMQTGSSEISSIYQTPGLTSAQQTTAVQNAYARMQSDISALGAYYRQSPSWSPNFPTSGAISPPAAPAAPAPAPAVPAPHPTLPGPFGPFGPFGVPTGAH